MHPHISAFQNWRRQAGLAAPSRGAPDLTRERVWRKGNLGPSGFVLSSSPHDLRENPACQSFLWATLWRHPEWFETLINPQQRPQSCIRQLHIHRRRIQRLHPKKTRFFDVEKAHKPDGIDLSTAQAEKYTGTRLPRFGKACGLPYHEAPSSRPLYGGTKNHADDSKARTPDFFHPLLLHDDIRHATGSAGVLRASQPGRQIFSDRLSDVMCTMRDHTSAHNLLGDKVTYLPCSPTPVPPLACVPHCLQPTAVLSACLPACMCGTE